MNRIESYFTKAQSKEETIPKEWLSVPLPKRPKRPVGRPRKTTYARPETPPAATPPPTPQTPTHTDTQATPTLTKRGKYIHYTTKEKIAIVHEARLHSVRLLSRNYKMSHTTLVGWMKMDFENTQLTPGARQSGTGRSLSYPTELEQNIVQWVL